MSKNKPKLRILKQLYSNRCMFTDVRQDLTFHHIDKLEYGGDTNPNNGAILSSLSQDWLHNYIEKNDIELYDLINECLILYKMVMDLGDRDLIAQYRNEIIPLYQICIYNNSKRLCKEHDPKVRTLRKEMTK